MAPKKKRNSFFYFMKELQEKYASRGNNISINDMAQIAHPIWKGMSLSEKEPYEKMAKEKRNDPGFYKKLASDGTKVEDNVRELEEEEKRERKMKQDIKSFCNVDCGGVEQFKEYASRKVFYILSFNILCRTEENIYIPIEVGLVEYSIQHGIHREYHRIINPGPIPTGYTGDAKRHSEDKHQIPIFEDKDCEIKPKVIPEKNPKTILDDLKAFINPHDFEELPPVFCSSQDLELTHGCLCWLSRRSRSPYEEVFNVFNITYLLMELRAGVGKALPSDIIASELLLKNSFDYHPNSRCEYHEEVDTPYCALGYSKRLCFLLSDAVCELFDVDLTERHIPSRALEEKNYEIVLPSMGKNIAWSAGRGIGRGIPPSSAYNSHIRNSPAYDYDSSDFDDSPSLPSTKSEFANCTSRQPASISLAQEMTRLKLKIAAPTVPGHGIGRAQPRK